MTTIKVCVVRALMHEGEPRGVGEVLELDAVDAGAALASGRAQLVDDADAALVRAAMTEAAAREVRALNASEQQNWVLRARLVR